MKKTAHIIYPFDLKKKINPWSIGNNLYQALNKDYKIKTYTWTSLKKIYPNKNDLLIGHCHSNPYTIFRRSVSNNNWYKKILVQPFNGDVKQMSHLYDIMPMCAKPNLQKRLSCCSVALFIDSSPPKSAF